MISIAEPSNNFKRHQDFALFDQHTSLFDPHMADCLSDPFAAAFPRTPHTASTSAITAASSSISTFVDPSLYTEPNYLFNGSPSSALVPLDTDDTASRLSFPYDLTSASDASSALSSPLSNTDSYTTKATQVSSDWASLVLGPSVISPHLPEDYFSVALVGDCPASALDDYYASHLFSTFKGPLDFVDPNLIAELPRSPSSPFDPIYKPSSAQACPMSPLSIPSPKPGQRTSSIGGQSPFLSIALQPSPQQPFSPFPSPVNSPLLNMPAIAFFKSSPPPAPSIEATDGGFSGDETKDRPRCSYPNCGRTFKDLKSHWLTHQSQRPEKCPIVTCDYHLKGFARRYDKNRHTLTHYKGSMSCGFCPGSGSAAEKSFNRADVFKRHLTAVHGVEQTAPNSRKRTSSGTLMSSSGASLGQLGSDSNSNSVSSLQAGGTTVTKLAGYPPDATGKCSTCSQTFANAQEFYEHLDECVLRIVQQEDPAEAINTMRLAEVEHDEEVARTLEKNNLPVLTATTTMTTHYGAEDEDMAEDEEVEVMNGTGADEDGSGNSPCSPLSVSKQQGEKTQPQTGQADGVPKSRGMTHSRGGVPLVQRKRVRKNRSHYPTSWGFDRGQMKMRKRVMAVFDGQRRLAKDDMLLSTDHEVRLHFEDEKSYVTDLDVLSLRRAEALHNATEDEKGPWISDDPTKNDLIRMREIQIQTMLERGEVFEAAP